MEGHAADGLAWGAALALVRWQRTRRGYEGDALLLRTGFLLLEPGTDGRFGPQSALARAEQAFNLSWQRITSEVLQFAVFLVTKAKRDDEQRPNQTRHALRLLQLTLNVFAARGDSGEAQITLPLNSCNLLLSALAEVLEKTDETITDDAESLQSLLDVKAIFLYLFGLPQELTTTTIASFQMYRPPTNVYAEFLKRALPAAFQSLSALQMHPETTRRSAKQTACVALVHAAVFVFQELQKTQANKKKVFLAIAKTSLRDMIAYRHALVTLQAQSVPGIGAVTSLLDRVLEDALFDSEHIRQFDGALVHATLWQQSGDLSSASLTLSEDSVGSKSKKRRKNGSATSAGLVSYQRNLFDELRTFLSDPEVSAELKASAGGFLEVLVRGFAARIRAAAHSKIEDTKTDLKTSRKRAAMVIATMSTAYSPFKFWSELCAVVFLAFQQQKSESDGCEAMEVLVTLYNSLFRALCEGDVYRVTEDTEEREQFQTMEKVLSSFLELAQGAKEAGTSDSQAAAQCQIISSAVRCSPNLVDCCLAMIFELLGDQVVQYHQTGNAEVLKTESEAMVELIRAYDSMRLLDTFLTSACAIRRSPEGLYQLLARAECESTLRKAFMALPPGQVEVLWNLFLEQVASYSTANDDEELRSKHSVALVRLLFQTFMQEVHVTPQNRTKVVSLVSQTYSKVLAPLAKQLEQSSVPFSSFQRELFCIFGELLMFDSVLSGPVRAQTFGVMFERLAGGQFVSVMEELLCVESGHAKRKPSPKKTSKKAEKPEVGETSGIATNHGLGAAGIIKLCVHWLRKAGAQNISEDPEGDSDMAEVSPEDRERVTRLVIEYVIEWTCWDAVAFYLPELMADASEDECDRFFREILAAFISETNARDQDGPARRILCDAGFYEIPNLRAVAPRSFTQVGVGYVKDWQSEEALSCLTNTCHLFGFLSSLPPGYLEPAASGELLAMAFSLYNAVGESSMATEDTVEVRREVLAWIESQFKPVALEIYASKGSSSLQTALRNGARCIFAQIGHDTAVNVAVVAQVLDLYLRNNVDSNMTKELLSGVLGQTKGSGKPKSSKKQSANATELGLKRAAIVVEAAAASRHSATVVSAEEQAFIDSVVGVVEHEKLCVSPDEPLAFEMLNALLKYQSAVHNEAHKHKQKKTSADTSGPRSELLVAHVGDLLAAAMKLLVTRSEEPCDPVVRQAAWSFFVNFCKEFPSFRSYVTPLETYGCLLAVALTLVSSSEPSALLRPEQPLEALVNSANKDEFRLLLSTVVQELISTEVARKISALRALCFLLRGDRKLSSSRRQHLNERKEAILEALLQNFAQQSLHSVAVGAEDSTTAELTVWNLQAFVLVFCKAELFAWKSHELQHVFTGFQPLVAVVARWKDGSSAYDAQQLHQLWTLSYTLLLRVVRHHFASLVNGISHFVQAANALLQLLVLASSVSESPQHCAEWSSNLARLYGYMKEHDTQLRKHVVYLIMTFLVGVTRDKLAVRFQQKLRPGIFALLDVCSPYEKEQLYAALDSTGKSLLKTLDTNYKLTHRYVGKV